MSRRSHPAEAPPRRTGISRRAMIGLLAGSGAAAAASLWLLSRVSPPPTSPSPIPPTPGPEPPGPEPPPFAHPPIPDLEPLVRVRVLRLRSEDDDVLLGGQGQWLRVTPNGQPKIAGPALRAPLRVRLGASGWNVNDHLGFRSPLGGGEPFSVSADEASDDESDASTIRIAGRTFPGSLRFVARTNIAPGAFDVVNDVALEEYLPGVVSKELYNHWHEETHAAQAIAARSFACSEHAYFRNRRHFDLTDGQSSQVYSGATDHGRSIDAVAATRGEVLAYNSLIVPGYYSSCCGGVAAAAPDAIGPNPINSISPLRGQSEPDLCTVAPVCTWRTQRPIEMTTQRIVAWAKQRGHEAASRLEELFTFEPSARNEHGRPTHYVLTDIYGYSVELPAERVRQALNYAEPGLYRPPRLARSSHFTVTTAGDDFLFEGTGFGHGVGMCQHGAQIRAQNGANHREILQWYYPDVEIVRAYA